MLYLLDQVSSKHHWINYNSYFTNYDWDVWKDTFSVKRSAISLIWVIELFHETGHPISAKKSTQTEQKINPDRAASCLWCFTCNCISSLDQRGSRVSLFMLMLPGFFFTANWCMAMKSSFPFKVQQLLLMKFFLCTGYRYFSSWIL